MDKIASGSSIGYMFAIRHDRQTPGSFLANLKLGEGRLLFNENVPILASVEEPIKKNSKIEDVKS